MRNRTSLLGVVLTVVVCGTLGLGAGSAWGALSFPFDGPLAPAGGSFAHEVKGIAVDDGDGQTYVAEEGGVDVFETASGVQLASLDGSLTPAGSFGGGSVAVAADDASGLVYVLDSEHGVVDVFDAAGSYVCQITGSTTPSASECNGVAGSATPAGGLHAPEGVAVDQATGRVYVVDANDGVVDVFSSDGAYLPASSLSLASVEGGYYAVYMGPVAVDDANGHVYLADSGRDKVYEFGALGEFLSVWAGASTPAGSFGGGYVSVAADDASGRVYVTDSADGVTDVFDAAGAYLTQFGRSFQESRVTGVDQANGRVYVSDNQPAVEIFGPALVVPDVTTDAASGVLPTGATLNGVVNPDGVQLSDCHFEYGTSTAYGQSASCVPAAGAIPADSNEHAVSATLKGLMAGTTYHFRLVAANANGPNTGADATFATPPPPSIEDVSARNVTATSADLAASIDPNGYDTTYRFEWGTSTAYGTSVPVPDADLGAGTGAVPVSTHLSGLSIDTTYHWRIVASSVNGTTTTPDQTFVYNTAGVGLPDGRAYEMVTPVQKNAALIGKTVLGVKADFSGDGSRLVLTSIQCFAGAGSCTGDRYYEGEPFLFARSPDAWLTSPWAPSATQFGYNSEWLVSAEAGTALFSIATPPAGEDDWYAREPNGSFVDIGPTTPPAQGTRGPAAFIGDDRKATADLSHVVWNSEPVWPFDDTEPSPSADPSVYEYVGAGNTAPLLVGVSGGRGSTDLISVCETESGGSANGEIAGSLSADGSTVFFTAFKCSSGSGVNAGVPVPANELFARIDESRSVLLSGRSPAGCTSTACLNSPPGGAQFEGASADGSRAFFASTQQLTDAASEDSHNGDTAYGGYGCEETAGVNGCNLYEYDFARSAQENPVAVSAGDTSGGGPRVQGVVAISSDGSHVYFVAKGVLSSVANGEGQVAQDGADNLYVFERDTTYPAGHVAFIVALPQADSKEWQWIANPVADVTPDGRFLVFTSHGALTLDDSSVNGAAQVFRYDAQTASLIRISIGDEGFNDNGNAAPRTPCVAQGCPLDASIAPPMIYHAGVARLDPTMSDDGSYVFFRSPVGLTPGALDDAQIATGGELNLIYAQNVYEYHDGRVYLISDGKDLNEYGDASDVTLIGSDTTGTNVFFTTSDPLVPQDDDTELDVYDARMCSTSSPCIGSSGEAVSCQGEACHGTPPATPAAPGAGSVTFAGPGNLAPPPLVASKKAPVKKHVVKHERHRQPKKKRAKRSSARGARRGKGGRS